MVIFLRGTDTFRSQRRFQQLRDAFRDKYDPNNLGTLGLDGQTMSAEELRNAVASPGFFSAKRFLGINHYDPKQAAVPTDRLNDVLGPLVDSKDVIVVIRDVPSTTARKGGRKPAKGKTKKAVLRGATIESFESLDDTALQRWIRTEVKQLGGSIDLPAAKQLIAFCGNDLWRINNELNKLVQHAGTESISADDVEHLVQSPEQSDVFALTDALGQRQRVNALALLEREFAAGANALALIGLLSTHVRRILMVQQAVANGASPATLASDLSSHPFVIKKALDQSKNFTPAQLQAWHHQLLQTDYLLKSTPLDPAALLGVLILRD